MTMIFRSSTIVFLMTLAFLPLRAERVDLSGCYAEWAGGRLTVGNGNFERSWVAEDAGIVPVSFVIKNPDTELMSEKARQTKAKGALEVTVAKARRSATGTEGVLVTASRSGKKSDRLKLWVFPETSGTLTEGDAAEDAPREQEGARRSSGVEQEPGTQKDDTKGGFDTISFDARHVRVSHIELRDRTDDHNELVFENEWLLSPNEKPFDLRGCVLSAENVLTGSGLVFLKLSPLPHARQNTEAVDFTVRPAARTVAAFANGYPVAVLGYHGGHTGRTRALHTFQRSLRNHKPGRDGLFLSNTWGDRSRDARINEEFLLKEVAAGATLGVDVLQIDDGWQKGRSANSASGKGVWNGYWAADPEFWTPDPVRFPNGLENVVAAARGKGMKFGLWFGPDSSDDAKNWQKDADHLLGLHRKLGIDYFKIDSMKTHNAVSLKRQRDMFDRMLEGSSGAMTFDLDVTAEIRPGYFGLPDIGPIFLQNRYTDWGSYWPHLTLRNLWTLSQTVDPLRLRMEVLNNRRNPEKYGDDPLAPAFYKPDTLFAMVMMANPLGWFEVSNLAPEYVAGMQPLIKTWKAERARMHGGSIVPVGAKPDGVAWTGFVSAAADGKGGYVLLFRGLNPNECHPLDLTKGTAPLIRNATKTTIIGGRGEAVLADGALRVTVPEMLDFLWVKLE